jgi:hypothetical protein
VGICITLIGCKKDPQIKPLVLDINAGDSTSQGIHFVKLNKTLSSYNPTSFALYVIEDRVSYFEFEAYIQHYSPQAYSVLDFVNSISPLKNAFICIDVKGHPRALNFGDRINDTMNWLDSTNLLLLEAEIGPQPFFISYVGNWRFTSDKYLGFKIIDRLLTYKGWIRIGESMNGDKEIKDFAFVTY